MESAPEIGRVGPLRLLPRQHITAQQTYLAAMRRYRGNSSVSFLAFANEGVRGSDPRAITEKELAPGGARHYAFADERKLLAVVEEELERRWKESGNDPWTQHQLGRCSEGLPRFKARRRSLLAQKDDGRALSSGSPEGVSGDEGKGGPKGPKRVPGATSPGAVAQALQSAYDGISRRPAEQRGQRQRQFMLALEGLLAGEVTDEHIDALLSMLRGSTARDLHDRHRDADALRHFMDEVRAALTRKADAAWPQSNRHGVYSESDAETLAYTGAKPDKVRAAVHVLQIGPDRWVSSYESQHLQGTSAGSVSPLTAQQTFEDRASALEEALSNVVTSQIQVNRDSNATPAQKRSADKVIEWCRQQRRSLRQKTETTQTTGTTVASSFCRLLSFESFIFILPAPISFSGERPVPLRALA